MDTLFTAIYDELRKFAEARGITSQTVSATDLVHLAYLRFVNAGRPEVRDPRSYFFRAIVNQSIEQLRRRRTERRGGGARPLPLEAVANSIVSVDEFAAACVENRAIRHEALLRIEGAFLALCDETPDEAFVFWARYVKDLGGQELANILGEGTPEAATRRARQARDRLLQMLGIEQGMGP